jgi:hypothetical protein
MNDLLELTRLRCFAMPMVYGADTNEIKIVPNKEQL